jgi:AraC-like DNA-binding protein
VGDLAERLEVSQEYLTRTFRDHVGMTPGKYLNQVRVEHAKLLLQRGDHNVSFISSACGFTNGNYFARVFREHVGMTPSVYAREHRGQEYLPQPQLDSFYLL